jgi:hypothetical protein
MVANGHSPLLLMVGTAQSSLIIAVGCSLLLLKVTSLSYLRVTGWLQSVEGVSPVFFLGCWGLLLLVMAGIHVFSHGGRWVPYPDGNLYPCLLTGWLTAIVDGWHSSLMVAGGSSPLLLVAALSSLLMAGGRLLH